MAYEAEVKAVQGNNSFARVLNLVATHYLDSKNYISVSSRTAHIPRHCNNNNPFAPDH